MTSDEDAPTRGGPTFGWTSGKKSNRGRKPPGRWYRLWYRMWYRHWRQGPSL